MLLLVVAFLLAITAAHAQSSEMRFVFEPVRPPGDAAPGPWQRVVLRYDDAGTARRIDTGLVDVHCAHDAFAECSYDPAVIRLRASCIAADGTGAEAEVFRAPDARCALRTRTIDAANAARGVRPEWTVGATVPCPPPGSPCPHTR